MDMADQKSEMTGSGSSEGLKREIGVVGLSANVINCIVGGGIFVLPAIVAAGLGPASILAYLLCGVLIILIMLCFAEIGSSITVSGGAYAYVEEAFGPFAGFLVNTLFWFGFGIFSDAAIANAMADMLAIPFAWLNHQIYRALFFLLLFGWYAWINIRGVKQGITMVKIGTLAKLIPLLILITVGWTGVTASNFTWTGWPLAKDLGEVSLILIFAFGGGEIALNASGEIINSKRTVPLGILYGIGTVIILYVLIQFVSQGVLGAELPSHTRAPLAAVAEKVMHKGGSILIIAGGVISIFGTLGGDNLSYPRLLFAGARNGLYPGFLSFVSKRFSTPVWAIVVYTTLVVICATSGGFKPLAIISSATLLLIYLSVVLSTIKLRFRDRSKPRDTFKIPGGLTIPVLALITIIWFLVHLARKEALGILSFLILLSVIYAVLMIIRRKNLSPDGKIMKKSKDQQA